MTKRNTTLFSTQILQEALTESLKKLHPKTQAANPVMFLVYVGAIATTLISIGGALSVIQEDTTLALVTTLWLWFTVLFANFAEAVAEGQAKAQACALKGLRKTTVAYRLDKAQSECLDDIGVNVSAERVESTQLKKGDLVIVRAGETIPCDGEVIKGIASVDESAVTGESAPVIRESGGDFSSVTGGTSVISDWLIIRATTNPGESFIEKMITMVEGAERAKTPNERALTILLIALTLIFLLVIAALLPSSNFIAQSAGTHAISLTVLIGLLVCLIPTTIGGLLSAVGVAGMSRLLKANVIARSGRAVEAAGDIDVLLLDKTGTITYGNRQADAFYPAAHIAKSDLMQAALLSSLADETPEGKSIVTLACRELQVKVQDQKMPEGAAFVPFSAQSRMSGVNLSASHFIRKGSVDTVAQFLERQGSSLPADVRRQADAVASRGSTPLIVTENKVCLGVVELKDIIKPGIAREFAQLRKMGIKTVMITGDNRLTAAAIASEAGVDDFLAQATPESKLACIRQYQQDGHLVAMTGDGTNDAPALAQADVAVAMNSGTNAAKEAANMVDLDSSPTKLMDVVKIGKQMLMTRGALTTFSLSNDLAKYFAVIPALFAGVFPACEQFNILNLTSPETALISAVIFNALIIIALIPLALKGVAYKAEAVDVLLRKNLLIYGLGGVLVPFVAIKAIDIFVSLFF